MKNIFRLSVMLLTATMAVGCSQNEEQEVAVPTQGDALTVMVTTNDFHSVEPASRAVENGYTTTFEAGDQIGIYALSKTDGKVFIKNRPLKKGDDGNWTGDKIYYYKNTDYIAYFPYTEKLSAETITSEEDIVAYFQSKLTKAQGTKEAYYACDLMSAKIEAANVVESSALNFDFAHKLSMIEVKLPVRDYKTSDAADAYAYYVPVDLTLTVNGDSYTAYAIDKGVYRCIVAPTVEGAELNVEGSFFDIDAPVTFSKSDIALAAGNYQKLKVNYAYDGYNPIRPLQVGDYYYADGNIYPGDLANPPATNCVGVIFATEGVNVTDGTNTWNHAYVMALTHTSESTITWSNNSIDTTIEPLYPDVKPDPSAPDAVDWSDLLDDMDGYSKTQAVLKIPNVSATTHPAFFAAANYGKTEATLQYAAPLSTTGWYLPSMGQLKDIINNLGVADGATKFGADNAKEGAASSKFDETKGAPAAVKNLAEKLARVGGYRISVDDGKGNLRWWSSNMVNADNAWCIDMNCFYDEAKAKDIGKYLILTRGKKDNTTYNRVRPVLAF